MRRSKQQSFPGENDELEEFFDLNENDNNGVDELPAQDDHRQKATKKKSGSKEMKRNDTNSINNTNAMVEIRNLKKRRRRLKKNVKDPLPDIIAKASTAIGGRSFAVADSNRKGADDSDTNTTTTDGYYSAASSLSGASLNNNREGNAKAFENKKMPARQARSVSVGDDSDSTTDDDEIALQRNIKTSNARLHGGKGGDDNESDTDKEREKNPPRKVNEHDEHGKIPSIYQKKNSAVSLKFTESSQSQTDDFAEVSPPKPKKRRMYTEEEKDAIKEGHKKYGKAWARIQRQYPVLKDRDQVSIKVSR